jgi:hypothetical protein
MPHREHWHRQSIRRGLVAIQSGLWSSPVTFRLLWVSRRAYDLLKSELEHAQTEQHAIRLDCARQINAANEQCNRAINEAREAIAETRKGLESAIEMSRLASKALFGGVSDEPASASSRIANDREETIRRRNEAMGRR